jgi:hypothetical protein
MMASALDRTDDRALKSFPYILGNRSDTVYPLMNKEIVCAGIFGFSSISLKLRLPASLGTLTFIVFLRIS